MNLASQVQILDKTACISFWVNVVGNGMNRSLLGRNLFNIVANALDCDNIVSKFKLQSTNYIQLQTNNLRKKYKPRYPSSCRLNINITVLL